MPISFRRIDKSIAAGHHLIVYHLNGTPEDTGHRIVASRHGIEMMGDSGIFTESDMQAWAKAVATAWQEHERIKGAYVEATEGSGGRSGTPERALGATGIALPTKEEKEKAH